MNILVLNSGSSSMKCSLFHNLQPVWQEKVEWKGILQNQTLEKDLQTLLKGKSVDRIGHRIVHGGTKYTSCVRIDETVKKEIRSLASLAPLHNLADLAGIEILEKLYPRIPQFAVFDTAFHHTLPLAAKVYPGPAEWRKMGIQRFGFHGSSFQYCSGRAAELLGKMPKKMVICHLGSGASLAAILNGKSVDTTMGFTPLEGLMMDTRSGTVDPGILLYLLSKKTAEELTKILYEESGLLGLSQISSDMRDILEAATKENSQAKLALDVYLHRLISLIGSMIATLGGLDTLVFTAGIGENAPLIRKRISEQFSFLGIHLDEKIPPSLEDQILSSSHSKVQVLLIHTQEALEIARQCYER